MRYLRMRPLIATSSFEIKQPMQSISLKNFYIQCAYLVEDIVQADSIKNRNRHRIPHNANQASKW